MVKDRCGQTRGAPVLNRVVEYYVIKERTNASPYSPSTLAIKEIPGAGVFLLDRTDTH